MNTIYILSLAGVAVFAISGALTAGRRHFDVFGVLVIAVATAIGGGTIRDVLLGRSPVFWIQDTHYLTVTTVAAIATIIGARFRRPSERVLLIADGLGLSLFTISGTQIAEDAGTSAGVAILMGCITGVAGGVIRDVLSAEAPVLFRNREIYATAAIVGSLAYLVLLQQLHAEKTVAAVIGMVVIAALRFASMWWQLRVPMFTLPDDAIDKD